MTAHKYANSPKRIDLRTPTDLSEASPALRFACALAAGALAASLSVFAVANDSAAGVPEFEPVQDVNTLD